MKVTDSKNLFDVPIFFTRLVQWKLKYIANKIDIQRKFCDEVKKNKIKKIINIKKLDKKFFGQLVETKQEKIQRTTLKGKDTESLKAEDSTFHINDSSELSWILLSSKHLRVLKLSTEKSIDKKNLYVENKTIGINSNAENSIVGSKKKKIEIESAATILKEYKPHKLKVKLPQSLIQYLPQYPISEQKNIFPSVECKKILEISADKNYLHYPSVTRILSATMSDEAKLILEKWKLNMIEKLGLKEFEIYQAELLSNGKLLHEAIECKITDKQFDIPHQIESSFQSLEEVFKNIDSTRAIETHVIHPHLLYRGIVDCIAYYGGKLSLIDWKKSDKIKKNIEATYDAPLQLASYIGAVNADLKYPFQIKNGLIVVAYTSGEPADVYEINENLLNKYWKLWLQRLQIYHTSGI